MRAGFVSSAGAALPPLSAGRGTCARVAPAMKAKGGRKAKAHKPAGATGGGGFGATPPAPAGDGGDGGDGGDIVQADSDGSIGESTPKRAFRPGGRKQLADPLSMEEAASDVDAEDGDSAMAAEAARLAAVRARAAAVRAIAPDLSLRWPWETGADSIVEMLAVAKRDRCLDEVVVANRDFVTQRVLYRFTSAILQAEGEGTPAGQAEAAAMRDLRRDVVDVCWHADRPLRDELFRAEARLVAVLQAPPESNTLGEVDARCGDTADAVNAFWLVVYGAVAAWEARDEEGAAAAAGGGGGGGGGRGGGDDAAAAQAAADAAEVQLRLKNVAAAVNDSRGVAARLSGALAAAGRVLTAADADAQAAVVGALDGPTVAEMRAMLEQVRLWPAAAYGPFADKLQAIVDYAGEALGAPPERMAPFRFAPAEIEHKSKLIAFKTRNTRKTSFTFS